MAKLAENECLVRTLKSYIDKETKKKYLVTDRNKVRKVTKERAEELVSAGVCEIYNPEQ